MDTQNAHTWANFVNPIRVAFPLLGRGGWTGGFVYLKNTLRLISSRLDSDIEAHVFLSPEEAERVGAELAPLCGGRLIVDPTIAHSGRGASLARAIVTGRDAPLERLLMKAGINVVFENAGYYGGRFAIPAVSWMPDFQHRHMAQMFSGANWWRRDIGFKMQIRSGRTIMLSSETARADLERFYPAARGKGHVVRFAIDLDVAPYLKRGAEMRTVYDLPERYFYLPNQFWRHKNHTIIIAALAQLRHQGVLQGMPPIILTGQPKDPRNPAHFTTLMQDAQSQSVASHFRYLGLIPYDHVLSLSANCDAQINPSHFEGWSTPIEEAKAFATPLVLSDIPIHREQAPGARFFDPASAAEAAAGLLDAARMPSQPRPPAAELTIAQNARLEAHADALLATIKAAIANLPVCQYEVPEK